MAVIKTTNPKVSTLKQGIKYITNPEKTEFITGKDCTAETALEEMQTTKALYNKTEGRQYMHFVQSFKPDDPLDPSKACLLYTSDAADEEDSVDLGGRRIIKKKQKQT